MKAKALKETHKRTLVKTLAWRVVAGINAAAGIYYLTGDLVQSINVGVLIQVTGFFIYYAYERYWNSVSWGIE